MLLQRCLILLVPNSYDLCNVMIILLGSLCYQLYWEGMLDFVFKKLGMGNKTTGLLLSSWLQKFLLPQDNLGIFSQGAALDL